LLGFLKRRGLLLSFVILVPVAAVVGAWEVEQHEPKQWQAEQAAKNATNEKSLDVLASLRVAYYTKVLAGFTAVLAVVGIGGIATSIVQIWYLSQADNRAAEGIRLSREQYRADRRAYVFLLELELHMVTGHDPNGVRMLHELRVRPRWKNSGTTPTKDLAVAFTWQVSPGDLPPAFPYNFSETPSPFFIGPGADEPQAIMAIDPAQANLAYRSQVFPDLPPHAVSKLFVWGRAEYKDTFDKTHVSMCCYHAVFFEEPQGIDVKFVQWGPYNRTEDG
jgi:hypothetical protein